MSYILNCFFKQIILTVGILTILLNCCNAQEQPRQNFLKRLFTPSLQMGYMHHNSDKISGGLLVQTSLEYRNTKGFTARINYDDFSGKLHLTTNTQTYSGKTPLGEVIFGFGFRKSMNKHNLFVMAQGGVRMYQLPILENINNIISLNQISKNIVTARYTFGYEYEIFERTFLNFECFAGNFFKSKDYWSSRKPYFGATIGITAALF